MKLRKTLTLALALVMLFCITAPAYAAYNPNEHAVVLKIGSPFCTLDSKVTMVDTANTNVIPVAESGRTLLPIRMLIEHFGGTIDWNGATQQVTCSLNGRSVVLTLESNVALVNGEAKELDVPATAREGRTLVPVRFVSENLNLNVKWEPTNNLVIVSDQPLPDDSAQLVERGDVFRLLRSPLDPLTVGGKNYYIDMTEAQLTALAGSPDDSFAVVGGYNYYVFGTKDYSNFLMAGVIDGKVAILCSAGSGFSYRGVSAGATNFELSDVNLVDVLSFADMNDNSSLHCIMLLDKTRSRHDTVSTSEGMYGESKINFHLTNAFRQYHGLPPLSWSDNAAVAARLHSEDMYINNYRSHYSLDGRSPGDRMRAQGISWSTWGENADANSLNCGLYFYAACVNTPADRSNMLSRSFTHLGVGFAGDFSNGDIISTQNYYG